MLGVFVFHDMLYGSEQSSNIQTVSVSIITSYCLIKVHLHDGSFPYSDVICTFTMYMCIDVLYFEHLLVLVI